LISTRYRGRSVRDAINDLCDQPCVSALLWYSIPPLYIYIYF